MKPGKKATTFGRTFGRTFGKQIKNIRGKKPNILTT
jgi:hypothetical protein